MFDALLDGLFNDLYPKGTLEEFPVEKLAVLSGVTGASSSPRQKTVRPSTFWDEDVGAGHFVKN